MLGILKHNFSTQSLLSITDDDVIQHSITLGHFTYKLTYPKKLHNSFISTPL